MPINKKRKNNPSARPDHGHTEQQKTYSTSEAVIALRDEVARQADANRDQPERKRKPSWIEIATLVLVVATTVLLVAQDVILNSSDETFKSTLKQQVESSERQLRAYIGIAPGDIENFGVADKWRVRFVRKNFGSTPGYNVGFSSVGFAIIKLGDPINTGAYACSAPSYPGLITMFPTTELDWSIIVSDEKVFDASQLQMVKNGTLQFVYWGTICYHDAFNKPHYTNYCWMYSGKSMTARDAQGCLGHNDSN